MIGRLIPVLLSVAQIAAYTITQINANKQVLSEKQTTLNSQLPTTKTDNLPFFSRKPRSHNHF